MIYWIVRKNENTNRDLWYTVSMTTQTEYKKAYYQKVKDNYKPGGKWRQYQLDYRNKPSSKERAHNRNQAKYRNNPVDSMFRNAKARARRRGLTFTITKEDIVIPELCPYLGVRLIPGTYAERKIGSAPTLDRIDSDGGYTKDNIEVISDLANRMKHNASVETLITFSRSVLARFSISEQTESDE